MLKMMWLAPLLILVSIGGCFCVYEDEHDCFMEKRKKCGEYERPTEFPQTAEEFLAACRTIEILASCSLEALESCSAPQYQIDRTRNAIDYVKATCQEDTPTFKAITNNLPCVERVIKSRENYRCTSILNAQNTEAIYEHIDLLMDDSKEDLLGCLFDLMEVACEGITFGHHCGEEVKEAVEDIVAHIHSKHSLQCTQEQLEELSPFMTMFEGLLIEELALQNALKRKRK